MNLIFEQYTTVALLNVLVRLVVGIMVEKKFLHTTGIVATIVVGRMMGFDIAERVTSIKPKISSIVLGVTPHVKSNVFPDTVRLFLSDLCVLG